jgi:ribonuclease HIII
VERALMQKGRRIVLAQMHRAESDPAVAAASVIAREQFLLSLRDMAGAVGIEIPKGASAAVREAAVAVARKLGPDALLDNVKCHFKTTDEVLRGMGLDRGALGPDGSATSKPAAGYRRQGHRLTEPA